MDGRFTRKKGISGRCILCTSLQLFLYVPQNPFLQFWLHFSLQQPPEGKEFPTSFTDEKRKCCHREFHMHRLPTQNSHSPLSMNLDFDGQWTLREAHWSERARFQAVRTLLKDFKCSWLRTLQWEMTQTENFVAGASNQRGLQGERQCRDQQQRQIWVRPHTFSTLKLNHQTGLGGGTSRLDQAASSLGTENRPVKKHLDYWYSMIQSMSGVWWLGEMVWPADMAVGHSHWWEGRQLDGLLPQTQEGAIFYSSFPYIFCGCLFPSSWLFISTNTQSLSVLSSGEVWPLKATQRGYI